MKRPAAAGRVRIIGGTLRGRRLPVTDLPGLRPTPDRTRETLFNWLGPLHDCRTLDLFAGSGALGLEAHSRGAGEVVLVERERRACATLQELAEGWHLAGVRIVAADAIDWLSRPAANDAPFDLVFLDPPFDSDLIAAATGKLQSGGWLAEGARIYVEYPAGAETPAVPAGWRAHREGRSARTRYVLYLS